ncbi:MAG: phosphatidate cytidylyltransferase [Candidatus Cloacimonetes bacterium]|nr:phosphatidate cytidylyltransferase [Candidatus Cloacimonadota bacterium]
MKPLTTRILSAIIFGPILLICAYFGGIPLQILISILSIFGIKEFCLLVRKNKNIEINWWIVATFGLMINWFIFFFGLNYIISLFIVFIILSIGYDVFSNKINQTSERIAFTIFALIYIPLLLEFLFLITNFEDGNFLFIFLMVLIWITDTAAYFIGAKFGKHRNIFRASEKKSAEGFLAGILSAFIFAYLINLIVNSVANINLLTQTDILIYGVIVGIFGQLGDLIESTIKRDFQVKDTSNLIPGHGGILDRFDSLMISAPLLYFYLNFIR